MNDTNDSLHKNFQTSVESINNYLEKKGLFKKDKINDLKIYELLNYLFEIPKIFHRKNNEQIMEISAEIHICKIRLKLKYLTFLLKILEMPILSKIKGMGCYILLHEIGETFSYLPFVNLVKNYNELKKMPKTEILLSKFTHSDIMGDLLSSTFSPLTPAEQLSLINTIERKQEYKIDNHFSYIDRGFIRVQRNILAAYLTRQSEKEYLLGKELFAIYKELLELQKGFTRIERKHFYFVLLKTLQESIIQNIEIYGFDILLNIETKIEILQKIVFDYSVILNNIKTTVK